MDGGNSISYPIGFVSIWICSVLEKGGKNPMAAFAFLSMISFLIKADVVSKRGFFDQIVMVQSNPNCLILIGSRTYGNDCDSLSHLCQCLQLSEST